MSDWDSAAGWDGSSREEREQKDKELRKAQRLAKERFEDQQAAERLIEMRPVSDWLMEGDEGTGDKLSQQAVELFPPFWNWGELAVMIGPSGSGKSRLGMQIADAVAAKLSERREGSDPAVRTFLDGEPRVAYLDVQRTWRQYRQRYSDANNPTGRTRFADLELGLLTDVATPESYKKKRHKFLFSAISEKLQRLHSGSVVVLDNLTWLARGESFEIRLMMRVFRRWV